MHITYGHVYMLLFIAHYIYINFSLYHKYSHDCTLQIYILLICSLVIIMCMCVHAGQDSQEEKVAFYQLCSLMQKKGAVNSSVHIYEEVEVCVCFYVIAGGNLRLIIACFITCYICRCQRTLMRLQSGIPQGQLPVLSASKLILNQQTTS